MLQSLIVQVWVRQRQRKQCFFISLFYSDTHMNMNTVKLNTNSLLLLILPGFQCFTDTHQSDWKHKAAIHTVTVHIWTPDTMSGGNSQTDDTGSVSKFSLKYFFFYCDKQFKLFVWNIWSIWLWSANNYHWWDVDLPFPLTVLEKSTFRIYWSDIKTTRSKAAPVQVYCKQSQSEENRISLTPWTVSPCFKSYTC